MNKNSCEAINKDRSFAMNMDISTIKKIQDVLSLPAIYGMK